jgi:endonuclease YncB( thermonuclease family)/DNA/RNA endonuclease YhcR with UshA esterase domain
MIGKKGRQLWMGFLAVLLVVTAFPFWGTSTAKAEGTISVAEAIANNSGTATVEGYIVAHTISSTSFDFEAPFGNDYNFALADSPYETDPAKLLPVQIATEYRDAFGLKTNPSLIGSKVKVTGTLAAYFSVPGLKSPTAMELADGSEPPGEDPPAAGVITIAEAKQKMGQTVTVQGVVTADNSAIGGGKVSTFMQDDTSGINIFAFNPDSLPELKEGQLIKVKGTITSYKKLSEIEPVTIEVLQENAALPEPKPLQIIELADAATAEPFEGQLVNVKGYIQSIPATPAGGGYNISLLDSEFNSTTLRVMEGSLDVTQLDAGKWYDITAIVSQYDDYQLIPRKAADIAVSAEQLPKPKPLERYTATVKRVSDGDTVVLEGKVLGADRVRMLSIDTPEKNYNGLSQGYHAEQASEALVSMLPVGTEISIEVGEDPLDNYGRLLGHIHVMKNGAEMDVNQEMVRLGMAVPYFIYPNFEHFEAYSAAAAEAIENGSGMWDPANPIEELPYEFRFNRKTPPGPDKFVGDYYGKYYTTPENWELIPVQNRVFFFAENDAIEAGFIKDDQGPVIADLAQTVFSKAEPIHIPVLAADNLSGVQSIKAFDSNGKELSLPLTYEAFELPLGEYSFTVEATDRLGNTSSKTFTITIEMPLGGVDEWLDYGFDQGFIEGHGIVNSLIQKVEAAQIASSPKEQSNKLNALKNQVSALKGKKLDVNYADELIEAVDVLLDMYKEAN